jgi:hypothetical protein
MLSEKRALPVGPRRHAVAKRILGDRKGVNQKTGNENRPQTGVRLGRAFASVCSLAQAAERAGIDGSRISWIHGERDDNVLPQSTSCQLNPRSALFKIPLLVPAYTIPVFGDIKKVFEVCSAKGLCNYQPALSFNVMRQDWLAPDDRFLQWPGRQDIRRHSLRRSKRHRY